MQRSVARVSVARVLAMAGLALGIGTAFAQPPPPPPMAAPLAPPAPGGNVQQWPELSGQVTAFSLTPRGDIDGVILADGTQAHLPPHLGRALMQGVRIGDTVSVRGLRAYAVPVVQAVSITDSATGQTIVDTGPPGPGLAPFPPFAGPPQPMMAQGRVRLSLYGPRGDLNGAMLEDGTQIHLPPPQAAADAASLAPGAMMSASGMGLTTPYGRVMDVQQISPAPRP